MLCVLRIEKSRLPTAAITNGPENGLTDKAKVSRWLTCPFRKQKGDLWTWKPPPIEVPPLPQQRAVSSILSKFNFDGSSQAELKNDNCTLLIHRGGITIEDSFKQEIWELQKQEDLYAEKF